MYKRINDVDISNPRTQATSYLLALIIQMRLRFYKLIDLRPTSTLFDSYSWETPML